MIKLVAFDWNGTLFADTNTMVKADNLVLKAFSLKQITLQKYRETFDIPVIKYWKAIGITDSFLNKHMHAMEDLFKLYYEPLADKTRTRAGARQVLKWLKSKKIRAIIYSNHTTPDIHKQLARLRIDKYITKILARTLDDNPPIHKRTKDQRLLGYVKQHKFRPGEVVSVGDTEEEIEIGKKFGFHTVAITGGYNTTARLRKHKPNFLIHNMLELINIIKSLNMVK